MAFQKFSEYLNAKDKMQEKPIVSLTADTGPSPTPKPPKAATKGKHWKVEGAQVTGDGNNEPKPYTAPGKDPGQPTYEKGLLYKGDQSLVYKPKTEDQRLKTDVKKESLVPYIKNVLGNNGALAINKIVETVELIGDNQNLFETLVREIKKSGNFEKFMAAVLDQPESYKEVAKLLTTSKTVANIVARAVQETVAPPEYKEDEEEPAKPTTAKTIKGGPATAAGNIKMTRK